MWEDGKEEETWKMIEKIDELGGALEAPFALIRTTFSIGSAPNPQSTDS